MAIGAKIKTAVLVVAFLILPPSPLGQAQRYSSSWQSEVIDRGRGDDVGAFSSLVIDSFGNFHVTYSNRNGTTLLYAFRGRQEKRWDTMTVDPSGGRFSSLTVDPQGLPHIAYNSTHSTGLHYAVWDGKEWHKSVIDAAKTNFSTSMHLGANGHLQISYYHQQLSERLDGGYLKTANFDGRNWYIQTVDHRLGTGRWNSIACDRSGHAYIAYSMAESGDLGFAYMEQSRWVHELADSRRLNGNNFVGYENDLQIGGNDEPQIAYVDATKKAIKYAARQKGIWHQELVDSLASLGAEDDRISLRLGRDGQPRVAYFDPGLGALKYAVRDGNKWNVETVESGRRGEYPSLYLDDNDEPYISYYATGDGQLRMAERHVALLPPPN